MFTKCHGVILTVGATNLIGHQKYHSIPVPVPCIMEITKYMVQKVQAAITNHSLIY